MNDLNHLTGRYFAIWNETDDEQRRRLIAQTWTESASYVDPMLQSQGHDGINAMVQHVQERYGGHRFRQTGDLDAHHDRIRFAWELAAEGGDTVVSGIDFGIVAADGRLQSITGFFDPPSK